MDLGLKGKTVLITGASGGIGLATARALAGHGARLALHYRSNRDSVAQLAEQLAIDGTQSMCFQADLDREAEVTGLFEQAIEHFGQLDVTVANAGIWIAGDLLLHEVTLERWEQTMRTDLTATFLTCREFMRHLADKPRESASIVMVGSTAAMFGEAGHADYAAAKAGMTFGLMRSLKNEIIRLAPRGRVNTVCPGWTDTPMAEAGMGVPGALNRATSTMAMRKIAEPEDVAGAIVYFASDRLSGHVSGEIITVAGGMEGRLLHDPTTSD
ncbi:MAG: SDR family oxidoreductase [Planctomycetes bacterium]|nr:SDR family oxidoreductase [Planctomycetota bacterium]